MTTDCIFCQIVAGDAPSVKVYEDADTIAFLDIGPVTRGHTLVIPRRHTEDILSTPPDTLQKLITVARRIARAQVKGLGAEAVNVTQANGALAGQLIRHIHVHVIPRKSSDQPERNWHPGKYENKEEMAELAGKIRSAVEDTDG